MNVIFIVLYLETYVKIYIIPNTTPLISKIKYHPDSIYILYIVVCAL